MKPWKDSDETFVVRTYRAKPGARVIPHPHVFGLPNWLNLTALDNPRDGEAGLLLPGLGVIKEWSPTWTGTPGHYCGRVQGWKDGFEVDLDPPLEWQDGKVSTCCGPAADDAVDEFVECQGGSMAGGGGAVPTGYEVSCSGGSMAGGSGDVQTGYEVNCSGGSMAGGSGGVPTGYEASCSGGSMAGGSGDVPAGYEVSCSGGSMAGGGGDVPTGHEVSCSGGSMAGGSGDVEGEPAETIYPVEDGTPGTLSFTMGGFAGCGCATVENLPLTDALSNGTRTATYAACSGTVRVTLRGTGTPGVMEVTVGFDGGPGYAVVPQGTYTPFPFFWGTDGVVPITGVCAGTVAVGIF